MKAITCVTAIIVVLFAQGCGEGDENTRAQGEEAGTATATATETPTETPTPEPDQDGDGTSDVNDFAPKNPKIQTRLDAQSCEAKGITKAGGKEGACTAENGAELKVVNRDTTLVLPQMAVHLNSIEATDTIAVPYDSPLVGSFVVANVSVTNRLNSPVEINGPDMFSLALGNRTYNPDFDAMNTGSDDSLVYEELQPDETLSGDLVFKVARKRVGALHRNGNLLALQFSDVSGFDEPKRRVGVIRTYN